MPSEAFDPFRWMLSSGIMLIIAWVIWALFIILIIALALETLLRILSQASRHGILYSAPFPHKTDWLHFSLGVFAGTALLFLPPVSMLLTIIYVVYQLTEREKILDTYLDIIEFLTGYSLGTTVAYTIQWLVEKLA